MRSMRSIEKQSLNLLFSCRASQSLWLLVSQMRNLIARVDGTDTRRNAVLKSQKIFGCVHLIRYVAFLAVVDEKFLLFADLPLLRAVRIPSTERPYLLDAASNCSK